VPRASRILVVDDDVDARNTLAERIRDIGLETDTAADAFEALVKYTTFSPDVVLTDLFMPGMDGIELVEHLRATTDPPAIVVMTGFDGVASAVDAMRAGAAEYLTKPLDFDELVVVLDKVFEARQLKREAYQLRKRVRDRVAPENIVGASPSMQRVFEIVDQVAPSRATVLILGETGTGKELVANAIHQRSHRANGPFIKLHCAALSESLLESELFGYERDVYIDDAFIDEIARDDGWLQLADGGTLFLDEIGDIPMGIQLKLLRFLEEHEFERVGGARPIHVDVRIIAASSINLFDEVLQGRFREDLFERLSVAAIEMTPLRDRRTDIPALARFFCERFAKEHDKRLDGFAPETLALLTAYDWPGNVRELESAIELAVIFASGNQLEPQHFPPSVRSSVAAGAPQIPGSTLGELARYAILETLRATGSTSKAAEMLGISVRTIQYRLHQYNETSHHEARKKLHGAQKT